MEVVPDSEPTDFSTNEAIAAIIAYCRASSKVRRHRILCADLQSKAVTMQIPDRIKAFHDEMTAWRQDLHAYPELGFEEHRTSAFVAGKLKEFGCEVHRNIGKTGVVGVLKRAAV
jgi:hypothetical protein